MKVKTSEDQSTEDWNGQRKESVNLKVGQFRN